MAVTRLSRADTTDYIEIYKTVLRKHRWRMKSVNGAKIGNSEQGRFNKHEMMANLERVTGRSWTERNLG